MASSASALRTQSAVSFFIEDLASPHDLLQKPVAFFQSPLQVLRCTDNDVKRGRRIDCVPNADGLVDFVASRHHHQEIDVTVGVRPPVSVGAEEDDPIWPEAFGDLLGGAI